MKNIERSSVCGGRRLLLHSNASKLYPFLNVFMNIKILFLNYATRPNHVSDCRLEVSGEVWFLHNLSDAVLLQSFFPFIAAWFAAWELLPCSFMSESSAFGYRKVSATIVLGSHPYPTPLHARCSSFNSFILSVRSGVLRLILCLLYYTTSRTGC